jgi:hypothetical protein
MAKASLKAFEPALEDFYTNVVAKGPYDDKLFEGFLRRWERKESAEFARKLRQLITAMVVVAQRRRS